MNRNTTEVGSGAGGAPRTAFGSLFAIGWVNRQNDMMQSVIAAVYPLLKDNYNLTFGQIGLITFVFQMTSSVIQPFIGRYADRHPRPYSLAAGMTCTLAGLISLAVAANYALVIVSVAIIGAGSSVFHPEASRVAQMASGGRKGLAQSIFQVGGNGGSAIGPLLAALIVLPSGQQAILWFVVAALFALGVLMRIGRWYGRVIATRSHRSSAVAGLPVFPRKTVRKAMTILVLMIFSKYFFISCMTSYFTFFLIESFGVSVRDSQFCLFIFLAAVAIGTVAGGAIGDRYGRKYVILLSILGSAPFALALPYINLAWTIAFAVIIGLVISSAFSAIVVYATDLMPDKVGMVAGIFFGLMFGLGGIGSAFFGWLADRTSIEFIFQVSTLMPLLGIVAAWLPNIKQPR